MRKLLQTSFFLLCLSYTHAQNFNAFWTTFQKGMQVKEYVMKNAVFPYYYSCNYLGDGEISLDEFKKDGIKIFINGNAFIANTFGKTSYPTQEDLSLEKYEGGYICDYLKEQFESLYGDLSHVYVVAEKGNENDAIGYKAYFIEVDNTFKFIGFEGIESGD